ncbi:hypothetical protein WX98_19415 [Pseudomonas syringae pv. persicae]|nr:hypothetical protein WX98_19415 [Pseudomonas syringae pv. persicae]
MLKRGHSVKGALTKTYHRIDEVSPGGVYTLFITSRWKGDWGFLVNGVKVAWREYIGEKS